MNKRPVFIFVSNKILMALACFTVLIFGCFIFCQNFGLVSEEALLEQSMSNRELVPNFYVDSNEIKWISFDVPFKIMEQALEIDVESHNQSIRFNWIELISYDAVKSYGKFANNKKSNHIDEVVNRVRKGENFQDIVKDLKMYDYYFTRYNAILSEFVGDSNQGQSYGLRAFSPIAKGYKYSNYDDFGDTRSYGYKRSHLGNDLFANVGTPVVAIEGGYIEVLGWNQYGGWRIGIRSHDKKRYYYYAHLRKNHPFHKDLVEGSVVEAGDVIGYVGMTGYSKKENTNNISLAHLHLGMQIIFDETQKEENHEIWINLYNIVHLLSRNRAKVVKDESSKDYRRLKPNSLALFVYPHFFLEKPERLNHCRQIYC